MNFGNRKRPIRKEERTEIKKTKISNMLVKQDMCSLNNLSKDNKIDISDVCFGKMSFMCVKNWHVEHEKHKRIKLKKKKLSSER